MKISNIYLYEGLAPQAKNNFILWESVGRTIKEAALNPAQITQLFQQIEQGATAAGGNRTAVGQTKDAAVAAAGAWKDLKNKIYDSAPMQNFASAYDQAAEKLKQATGGDQGAMQYVEKYRTFAKKHPLIQSFLYTALIAAAGISSAGLGGAAALALLKTTDKALQGEDIRSALYSGAKTGALAYGASKLGDLIRGDKGATGAEGALSGDRVADGAYKIFADKVARGEVTDYNSYVRAMNDAVKQAGGDKLKALAADSAHDQLEMMIQQKTIGGLGGEFSGSGPEFAGEVIKAFGGTPGPELANQIAAVEKIRSGMNESRTYTPEQVTALFEHIIIAEGLFDKFKTGGAINTAFKKTAQQVGQGIKQGAAAVGQQIQRVGHNVTTKTTADKLQSAWKKAGSPTDSEAIIDLLTAQGIDKSVITGAMKAVAPFASVDRSRLPDVGKLNLQQKQQLLKQLDAFEQGQQPTAAPAAIKLPGTSTLSAPGAPVTQPTSAPKVIGVPTDARPIAVPGGGATGLTVPGVSNTTATPPPTTTGGGSPAKKPKVAYSDIQPKGTGTADLAVGKVSPARNPGAPTPDEQAKFQQKLQAAMQKQA